MLTSSKIVIPAKRGINILVFLFPPTSSKGSNVGGFFLWGKKMKIKIFILILLLISSCNCTNEKDADRALKALGFTEVQVTGYNWFACSEDDWYHTGFKAINPKGELIYGTVCSGLLFKNSTVRF